MSTATAKRPISKRLDRVRTREAYYTLQGDDTDEKIEVDEENHIIRNVWIVGNYSRNMDRTYPQRVLESKRQMYEGKPVNLNHQTGEYRDVDDRFGVIQNVRPAKNRKGLRGDLNYNPNHEKAGKIIWFAKNNPNGIGLSPDAIITEVDDKGHRLFRDTRYNGPRTVTDIIRVDSVDIVADPATTHGLEAMKMDETTTAATDTEGMDSVDHIREHCCKMVEEALAGIDDLEKLRKASAKIEAMLGKLSEEKADEAVDDEEEDPMDEGEKKEMEGLRKKNAALEKRLDAIEAKEAARKVADEQRAKFKASRTAAEVRAREAFKGHHPTVIQKALSNLWLDELAAKDEAGQKALIAERLDLVGSAVRPGAAVSVARESIDRKAAINGGGSIARPEAPSVDELWQNVMANG